MNRTRFEVIAEILELSKEGASKTAIISNCSLTWNQANRLTTQLLDTHLLELSHSFQTTEKGLRFIKIWKSFKFLLQKKQITNI